MTEDVKDLKLQLAEAQKAKKDAEEELAKVSKANERLDARVAELAEAKKAATDALKDSQRDADALLRTNNELKAENSTLLLGRDPYKLTPLSPNSVVSVHTEAGEKAFIYHERLKFSDANGYSATSIHDKAKAAIDRAFEPEISGGRLGENCSNLPPFDPGNTMDIIIKIKPGSN